MKRKFTKKPITASWTDAYKQMEEVFDPLWNDEVVYYETHEPLYGRGPAMQAVYELYRKHKGEADWDEAYRRFTEPKYDIDGAIMATKIFGQDAGMVLEVFQDAVDEIEIPEGYNWEYKIDQLETGETAGQLFIMTDDNQPVYFVTFSLEKDGQPLDILNDRKLYDSLVKQVKKSLDELGDFEAYVGKPKQETIELATSLRQFTAVPRTICAAAKDILGLYRRYYRLLNDKDLAENGWSWKDFDDTYSMREYGIAYLGTAIIDSSKVEPSVYNTLTDAGYEILSIGEDESTGEVGLYLVSNAGFRPELVPFEDIESVGEYEGYVEDVYY